MEVRPLDHHSSSSDTDSDFVRVDQSMVADTNDNLEESNHEASAHIEDIEVNNEGAEASPPYKVEEPTWHEHLLASDSNLGECVKL